jgi:hypothetical protein
MRAIVDTKCPMYPARISSSDVMHSTIVIILKHKVTMYANPNRPKNPFCGVYKPLLVVLWILLWLSVLKTLMMMAVTNARGVNENGTDVIQYILDVSTLSPL